MTSRPWEWKLQAEAANVHLLPDDVAGLGLTNPQLRNFCLSPAQTPRMPFGHRHAVQCLRFTEEEEQMFRLTRTGAPIRVTSLASRRSPQVSLPKVCFLLALSFQRSFLLPAMASNPPHGQAFKTVELNVREGSGIHFAHLSTDQGLSDSAVFNILQDDQGFMWFGTPNGLNRYDGYEFKVYRPGAASGGLSGAMIIGLMKDRSGALWFGADRFLDRFDPISETVTQYAGDPNNPASLGGSVSQVAQDAEGQIW